MSISFKFKEKKKKDVDKRITLDAKNNQKIDKLKGLQKLLPVKKKERKKILNQIKELESKRLENLNNEEIETLLTLKEDIKLLEKEIINIEEGKEEKKYLLDTGHLLFDYYKNIENISKGNINTNIEEHIKKEKNTSVLDFFKGKKLRYVSNDKKNLSENNFMTKDIIVDKYLSLIDKSYIRNLEQEEYTNIDMCQKCKSEKNIILHKEGITVCKECGETQDVIIHSDKPSYKDPPREISYFAYKRINHFNEWLAQFQAKESTDIPEEVYNKILLEIKKERIKNMANLTPAKLREILKKLKLNKYYEHVPHIISRLNGIPAPVMTHRTEEKLRFMFKEIQIPFIKHCPKDRKNFLSYSYVLHKFVQLLGLDEFLPCFPLLKSREKLHQQDIIWKKICKDLRWQFIKSL